MPGAGNPQALNRYSMVFNNPLRYTDPTGHFAYDVVVRSFAPFDTFGFGFYGDNRGYSNAWSASHRVALQLDLDTDKRLATASVDNSASHHVSGLSGHHPGRGGLSYPTAFRWSQDGSRNEANVFAEYHGSNGVGPQGLTPEIDVYMEMFIVENKKASVLLIKGSLEGDNFPATEGLIRDASGQTVFLGIGFYDAQGGNKDTGPFSALPGDNKRPITTFELSIALDGKGIFKAVIAGGTTYSVADWNRRFLRCDPNRQGSC